MTSFIHNTQGSKLELKDFDDLKSFRNFTYHNTANNLKIVLMNIRSLNSNFTEFEHFLDNISIELDFIILTETWSKALDLYKNRLSNYNMVHSEQSNKSGGTVIFYHKNTIHITESSNNIISESDSVSITFDYRNKKNQTLLAIYRSPSRDPAKFVTSLNMWVKTLKTDNILAIAGDFNICKKKYYTDKNSENLYDTMLEHSLLPAINTDTRIDPNGKGTGTVIDQIFLNYKYLISCDITYAGNYNAGITDHKLQYLFMQNDKDQVRKNNERPFIRVYNDKNKDTFKKTCKN